MKSPVQNQESDFIKNNLEEYLNFIHSRFSLIHNSNFFFRDLHHVTLQFLEEHRIKSSSQTAESVAKLISAHLVDEGIFKKIDHQSWMLNYPKFTTPKSEKKAIKA